MFDGIAVTGDVGDHRRRATRSRLGDRHPPAFVSRRAGEEPGAAIPIDFLVLVHEAGEAQPTFGPRVGNALLDDAAVVALAHDHSFEVGDATARVDERVDEQRKLLHRHQPADRDDERRG